MIVATPALSTAKLMPVPDIAMPALVAKVKVSKEKCQTVIAAPAPDIATPVLVTKAKTSKESAPVPFHLHGIVMETVSTKMDNQGCSCKEHINCAKVIVEDMVVRLQKVQISGRRRCLLACG
jgi:hypothetical protein